jgi:hypothetical protein
MEEGGEYARLQQHSVLVSEVLASRRDQEQRREKDEND